MAKIMVVDDDYDIVKLVSKLLRTEGHEVIPAYGGKEALQKLEAERPDLITLDIMMPQVDGFDVLQSIRANKEFSGIPVIIVSVRKDETDVVKGLELGANDYFTKPYNRVILLAKIRSVLRFKKMEDQLKEYSEDLERKVDEKTKELKEAHEKLKVQYNFLERDLDLAHLQMEHDSIRTTYVVGLTGILTVVLIFSMIILISTWNIDYLLALVVAGVAVSALHIRNSQRKMQTAEAKIGDLKKKRK